MLFTRGATTYDKQYLVLSKGANCGADCGDIYFNTPFSILIWAEVAHRRGA
jgi:hypothetical protein